MPQQNSTMLARRRASDHLVHDAVRQAVAEAEAVVLDSLQAEVEALRAEVDELRSGEGAPAPAPSAQARTRRRPAASRQRGTVSVLEAIPQVLGRTPMNAKDITAAVQQVSGVKLTGQTPVATVAARLATEAKKSNGLVRRTAPGMFVLRGRSRAR